MGATASKDDAPFETLDADQVRDVVAGFGGRVASVRRTDESYEGAVSPPRRLFVGAAEKRRKRVRPA